MFTDPYSGKFNLWQGAQNLGPLIMQYMLMKELMGNKGADMAGAKAQGMASMMPNRPMQQAQPMGGSYLQTVGGVAGGPGPLVQPQGRRRQAQVRVVLVA